MTVKFLNLFLFSQRERRALIVPFRKPVTIIRAGNSKGKSAVIKSLYDSFGATPNSIDKIWSRAGVTSAVEFEFRGHSYTAIKSSNTYSLFDYDGNRLVKGGVLSDNVSNYLANLFDFKLVMADRNDKPVIPPPAYQFSPFYIDQDGGWDKAWSSFNHMSLPKYRHILPEYHSGIKSA